MREPQIQKMTKYLEKTSDEAQISHMVEVLSAEQFTQPLYNLK